MTDADIRERLLVLMDSPDLSLARLRRYASGMEGLHEGTVTEILELVRAWLRLEPIAEPEPEPDPQTGRQLVTEWKPRCNNCSDRGFSTGCWKCGQWSDGP